MKTEKQKAAIKKQIARGKAIEDRIFREESAKMKAKKAAQKPVAKKKAATKTPAKKTTSSVKKKGPPSVSELRKKIKKKKVAAKERIYLSTRERSHKALKAGKYAEAAYLQDQEKQEEFDVFTNQVGIPKKKRKK